VIFGDVLKRQLFRNLNVWLDEYLLILDNERP